MLTARTPSPRPGRESRQHRLLQCNADPPHPAVARSAFQAAMLASDPDAGGRAAAPAWAVAPAPPPHRATITLGPLGCTPVDDRRLEPQRTGRFDTLGRGGGGAWRINSRPG